MGGYALGIGLPAHAFMAVAFASGMFAIAKLIEPTAIGPTRRSAFSRTSSGYIATRNLNSLSAATKQNKS